MGKPTDANLKLDNELYHSVKGVWPAAKRSPLAIPSCVVMDGKGNKQQPDFPFQSPLMVPGSQAWHQTVKYKKKKKEKR